MEIWNFFAKFAANSEGVRQDTPTSNNRDRVKIIDSNSSPVEKEHN